MEKKTGIAVWGGTNTALETDEIGKGWILPSFRACRCFGLIVRAKLEKEYCPPDILQGKRVLWVMDSCIDHKSRRKPSLSLYAKKDLWEPKESLPILRVWAGEEKMTTIGGSVSHKIQAHEVLLDHQLLSGGGTHWTRQIVFLCNDECQLTEHWTSNAGNIHPERTIQI